MNAMTMSETARDAKQASSRGAVRAGWALSGLAILFLAADAAMKLMVLPNVTEASAALGWPTDAATTRLLGVGLLASALAYAAPRTAVLGAILLTGYLGGAVARTPGSAARSSATPCSGSISGSSSGEASGFATRGCAHCCRSAADMPTAAFGTLVRETKGAR